jgi:hypothetical protein
MYIVVQHQVSDPSGFWAGAQEGLGSLPSNVKLHQSFPSPDGSRAVCVWEAESIDGLRAFLDTATAGAQNEYFEVVNKDGIAMPTAMTAKAGA